MRNAHIVKLAYLLLALMPVQAFGVSGGFVGSETCAACHMDQFQAWKDSHHALAMQHANEQSVLGDFSGTSFTYSGITSRFFRKDGKYFVNTDGRDGLLADFKIKYTFGVKPLQQYLVEFPDGRLQALSIAWDSRAQSAGGQRWFHLYPDEKIDFKDELHWTGPLQNWNFMCADCHTTNLKKGYSATKDAFNTTWSEINVSCESCHGPGQNHLSWVELDSDLQAKDARRGLTFLLDDRTSVDWSIAKGNSTAHRSQINDKHKEVQQCASCHSRRSTIKVGAESDIAFLDHHMPAFLTEDLYYPDGQILDEVYVWGSFTQSKMYAAGVTCSDCHDPHSLQLRAQGDAVCAQCHLPTKFATSEHHHHQSGSDGASCLDCHMPQTTYMGVDARRDHSMRIPRPDHSLELNTPNACNSCHTDQSIQWAADQFKAWYPQPITPFQDWAKTFTAARSGDPQAETMLATIIANSDTPDIARATAVMELQNVLSQASVGVLQSAITDTSPLVRLATLRVLERLAPQSRYALAARLLEDPVRAVRIEAGRVLAVMMQQQLPTAQQNVLENALREYIAAQELHADRVESQVNLGNMYVNMNEPVQAEQRFRKGISLDPLFVPAYVNLSDLYRDQGLNDQALKVLHDGIAVQPDASALHHALGLALVRQGNNQAALAALKKALDLAPETARYAYVYGVALNSTGQANAGITALEKAYELHPNNRDILLALTTINRDSGQIEAAKKWAEKLLALNPADTGMQQLLQSLR